jgi:hypothetical protein
MPRTETPTRLICPDDCPDRGADFHWHGTQHLRTRLEPIRSLRPFDGNPRRGNVAAIADSLRALGQYKAVTVNAGRLTGREREILAGNHSTRAAAEALGWTHMAADWVDVDDVTARKIVAADNRTSDLGDYDDAELAALLNSITEADASLFGTGYVEEDLSALLDLEAKERQRVMEHEYTAASAIPRYDVVGDEPAVPDLTDPSRMLTLRTAILDADLPDDVRGFLLAASYRHLVFNYRRIAEFYPHQSPEVQRLMEDSALVIIDTGDAIRNGYLAFTETIAGLMQGDMEADAT